MLSPAKIPNLNNASTVFGGKVGSFLSDQYGDLDKRNKKDSTALGGTVFDVVNVASAVADGVGNALGLKSPYYTIGEIPYEWRSEFWEGASAALDQYAGSSGSWLRAISGKSPKQEGVIIDCLGRMDGEWSTEFTQNPIFYGTNTAVDSRVRKPSQLTADVYISNYLSDDAIAGLLSSVEKSILGTSVLANALLYDGNTRAQQGLYKLIWLMENGLPFTVYTPHGIYESMLIKNIRVNTDDKSMDMLNATLTFEEIIMTRPYFTGSDVFETPARKVLDASKDTQLQHWSKLSSYIG